MISFKSVLGNLTLSSCIATSKKNPDRHAGWLCWNLLMSCISNMTSLIRYVHITYMYLCTYICSAQTQPKLHLDKSSQSASQLASQLAILQTDYLQLENHKAMMNQNLDSLILVGLRCSNPRPGLLFPFSLALPLPL